MKENEFSPYIRLATPSVIKSNDTIGERIIFDYELLYVEDGCIYVTVSNKKYCCEKGSVLLLRPGVPHTLEFRGCGFVSQPHIHFDTVFDEYSEKIYVSFHPCLEEVPPQERKYLRTDNIPPFSSPVLKFSDKARFDTLFFSVIECFQKKDNWHVFDYKIKMLELLKMIINDNADELDFQQETQAAGIELSSIKNFIDINHKNIITLESLEKQFHYDRFYISKIFKKYYGISIMKYYDNLRIEAAKRYLENGLSVSKITEILNFGSIYSFSRFFKTKVGYPPSKHKNKS